MRQHVQRERQREVSTDGQNSCLPSVVKINVESMTPTIDRAGHSPRDVAQRRVANGASLRKHGRGLRVCESQVFCIHKL